MTPSRPRSCLACCARISFRNLCLSRSQVQHHNISTSPSLSRKYPLPQFEPSSTPALAAQLALIRSQILVPGYITLAQRKLIRKAKYASQLANDPVYASIGDEEVRLKYINVLKDIPNQAWAFRRCLDLLAEAEAERESDMQQLHDGVEEDAELSEQDMEGEPGIFKVDGFGDGIDVLSTDAQQEKAVQHAQRKANGQDWLNCLGIVEGYQQSKISHLSPPLLALFVQRAMAAKQPGVVIRGLEQVSRNGLSLSLDALRFRVFEGLWLLARNSRWEAEQTEKCYGYTRRALDMMERPEHCGSRIVAENDPRTEPFGLGVMLELGARRILAAQNGQAEMDTQKLEVLKRQVRGAAERMVALLTQRPTDLDRIDDLLIKPAGNLVSLDIGRSAQLAASPTSPAAAAKSSATTGEVPSHSLAQGWPQAALAQEWLPIRTGLALALKALSPKADGAKATSAPSSPVLKTTLSRDTVAAIRLAIERVDGLLQRVSERWTTVQKTAEEKGREVPVWVALDDMTAARTTNSA